MLRPVVTTLEKLLRSTIDRDSDSTPRTPHETWFEQVSRGLSCDGWPETSHVLIYEAYSLG